ncbi:MAG: DUF4167 domain-containing protein [Pseudomonadota bacterium]|nr:DUF4167 domain-containing protein [Pseudomonadota bacterium]
MRRKPTSHGGGYNNQHRKPRFQQGGGHGQQGGHPHHRGPRRNWPAAQAKYLEQARNALASGDRVMAEYYYQHADHCYRMMVEEGQNRPHYTPPPQQQNGENAAAPAQEQEQPFQENNAGALPAFITASYQQPEPATGGEPPAAQNWEERDA